MAVTRISIDTPNPAAADQSALIEVANARTGLVSLAEFIASIGTGGRSGKVRLNTGAVQAEGSVTFASIVENDTVTVNGVILTGKDAPSGAAQFLTGISDESSANALKTLINASATSLIAGIFHCYRRATVLFTAIANADTVTVNGVVFTAKTTPSAADPHQFKVENTQAKTAEAFLVAVKKCQNLEPNLGVGLLSITRSTATLTINYDGTLTVANSAHATVTSKAVMFKSIIAGQIGNMLTLAVSAHGTAVTPVGGTEGTETVFANSRTIL